MSKASLLKDLAEQIAGILPTHLGTLRKDFAKNCEGMLSRAFAKFDLVSRAEFDAQTKVLLRTRKKLEELDTHIKELETRLKRKAKKS